MKQFLKKVMEKENLTLAEMEEAARYIFAEDTSDIAIGAFLSALKTKGETVDEITGLVNVMLEISPLALPDELTDAMDNCGTGGDGSQSFNVSTTSAFVIAGAGITVAKHGNRSISSKTGSADVLENLGVPLEFTRPETYEILKENGIAFLFAPNVHPAMKRAMKVRKELGVPTIFNVIGPLTNPVKLTSQLMGTYRRDSLETMAAVLHKLGRKRALIINGAGYMDEASLAGENHLVLLEKGEIMKFTLKPEEVGLPTVDNEQIKGGDSKENAEILRNVLEGKQGPHRDTVLFNAGLGIFANGKAETVQQGVELARESIDSGAALAKLDNLITISNRIKQEV
ncbi:anthranilate phosphoribosyltransferase [Gracilibacillus kekensis]|uniref:Anthranilate phosphoribosyltransferase n=1 Tax=Gracilibacillus kekensis TaxID=1027249 RepID=A0A1M7KME8_9BACI|nr:anthranilate phosphoribosyltransferase [Gracilibacillus kekensis]SHM66594.1 anthranilate phosphoribosyltransferase/anthranilate synthase/phosphoribosyltransferase [Gracilibacillus kekensis]